MNKRDLITFRDGLPTDMPFVYRSVLMGTYHGNKPAKGQKPSPGCPVDFFSSINQDTFMKEYHGFLESMFSRAGIEIKIACLVDDPDVILGFSVLRGPVLNFVFVKPDWRGIGIARDLVDKNVTTVSGFTRVGDIIRRKRGWSFNPWV